MCLPRSLSLSGTRARARRARFAGTRPGAQKLAASAPEWQPEAVREFAIEFDDDASASCHAAAAAAAAPLRDQILAAAPALERLPDGARPLAAALLTADEADRAAAFPAGYASVAEHAWFGGLDWEALGAGRCVADLDFAAAAAAAKADDGLEFSDDDGAGEGGGAFDDF